jgi:hypothetical protein
LSGIATGEAHLHPNFIMGLFALMCLPFRVIQIFSGFTFTDAEDFAPLFTLLIGGVGAVLLHQSPQKQASPSLLSLMLVLSLGPLLPNLGIFWLAREFQAVNGWWPQAMVDDPARQFGLSPSFDALSHLVNYLEAFSGAWMVVFLSLFLALQARFSASQQRLIRGLFLFGLIVVLIDPGNLTAWWLD